MNKRNTSTLQEDIDAINCWQGDKYFHSLTCGNDSNHAPLTPVVQEDKALLCCQDCSYTQVPDAGLMELMHEHKATYDPSYNLLGF